MSFSFVVDDDEYEEETHTRVIKSIKKLYDISAVAFPANPGTNIGLSMRDYFDGAIERAQAERLAAERQAQAIEKLKLKIKLGGINK
jgi:phage head maturation protease